jgi:hypothetical protein
MRPYALSRLLAPPHVLRFVFLNCLKKNLPLEGGKGERSRPTSRWITAPGGRVWDLELEATTHHLWQASQAVCLSLVFS